MRHSIYEDATDLIAKSSKEEISHNSPKKSQNEGESLTLVCTSEAHYSFVNNPIKKIRDERTRLSQTLQTPTCWYCPSLPKMSLPHPELKHRAPSKDWDGGGRQMVLTVDPSWASSASRRSATSLYWSPGVYCGWMMMRLTRMSWWGIASEGFWKSHSPSRTMRFPATSLKGGWMDCTLSIQNKEL